VVAFGVSIGSVDAGLIWVRDLLVGDVMVGDVMVDRSVRVEWTPALERERISMFPEAAAAGPAQR
jgi:hypothetical protein